MLKNCEVLQQSMVGSLHNKCSEACNAALILKLTSTVQLVHVLRVAATVVDSIQTFRAIGLNPTSGTFFS